MFFFFLFFFFKKRDSFSKRKGKKEILERATFDYSISIYLAEQNWKAFGKPAFWRWLFFVVVNGSLNNEGIEFFKWMSQLMNTSKNSRGDFFQLGFKLSRSFFRKEFSATSQFQALFVEARFGLIFKSFKKYAS